VKPVAVFQSGISTPGQRLLTGHFDHEADSAAVPSDANIGERSAARHRGKRGDATAFG